MDTTLASQSGFWIAIGIGGAVVASLSAGQQLMSKDQEPGFQVKPVIRDFFIGAFLAAIVYMVLPESVQSWVTAGQEAVKSVTAKAPTFSGGGSGGSGGSDIELQTGPARF